MRSAREERAKLAEMAKGDAERRKRPPGFVPEGALLQPTRAHETGKAQETSENIDPSSSPVIGGGFVQQSGPSSAPMSGQSSPGRKQNSKFDFLEFEQGLAPLDPWETPSDDLALLHEVMGGPVAPPKTVSPPSLRDSPTSKMSAGSPRLPQNSPPAIAAPQPHPYTFQSMSSSSSYQYQPSLASTQSALGLSASSLPGAQYRVGPSPPPPPPPVPPNPYSANRQASAWGGFDDSSQSTKVDSASLSSRPLGTYPVLPGKPPSGFAGASSSSGSQNSKPEAGKPKLSSDPSTAKAQELLEAMGLDFSEDEVSKALSARGGDEKKVINYFLAFKSLQSDGSSTGLTSEDIASALDLHNDDEENAARYLKAFASLVEMGWDRGNVKEALVLVGPKADAALEVLLKRAK
ncbi:hypothetical protein BJ742DRAFT_843328 [Cladochytrium replicatum]|nr:hypothetical protein BJ742DRAFT_843328 [Cladochytrium replicatum]